ncbi:MAG: SRPBCC domain-containing protein [bacterium]
MGSSSHQNPTEVVRISDREQVVTRTFNYPISAVFDAWTRPALLLRWWAPASVGLTFEACEVDARTGGTYRFVFSHPAAPDPMAFFGRYVEVVPQARLVWTNEEAGEGGQVTTVTFEACEGGTRVVMLDRHPSREALDDAISSGATCTFAESFGQLDDVLLDP